MESLDEEFNFWRKTLDRATGPDVKKKAEFILDCYKEVEEKWINLEVVDQKDFKELIEVTFYNLENIWSSDEFNYSPRRFAKLIKVFTQALWRRMCMMVP